MVVLVPPVLCWWDAGRWHSDGLPCGRFVSFVKLFEWLQSLALLYTLARQIHTFDKAEQYENSVHAMVLMEECHFGRRM